MSKLTSSGLVRRIWPSSIERALVILGWSRFNFLVLPKRILGPPRPRCSEATLRATVSRMNASVEVVVEDLGPGGAEEGPLSAASFVAKLRWSSPDNGDDGDDLLPGSPPVPAAMTQFTMMTYSIVAS